MGAHKHRMRDRRRDVTELGAVHVAIVIGWCQGRERGRARRASPAGSDELEVHTHMDRQVAVVSGTAAVELPLTGRGCARTLL